MPSRFALAALLGLMACEDRSYRDIGADVRLLAQRDDALVPPAVARLARFGRRALPQIETALHTATARGKVNLLRALEAIGDQEAVPVLRHLALFDTDPMVRNTSEALLRKWAAPGDPRAQTAGRALSRLAERRRRGEGPVETDGPGL